jgi:hypothetical protein
LRSIVRAPSGSSVAELTEARYDAAAAARDLDAASESETTTAEDEPVIFFCAEMSPAAARPRINKNATTPPARRMRISRAYCSDARGLLSVALRSLTKQG